MKRLAALAGKRGCCQRGNCIHRQAAVAVKRIEELESKIERLREALWAAEAAADDRRRSNHDRHKPPKRREVSDASSV